MPKNVVLCCDGTSNQPAHDMTNVVKLYFTLVNDRERQVTFYHPGLGTMEPPGALSGFDKWWTTTAGLAFGSGLDADIRDAYVFIAQSFEPGDRLYLFGFSRGAYTARAVTSLLRMYGLIEPDNAPLAPYAIRMMRAIEKADGDHNKEEVRQVFALAERFQTVFSRACKPHFVGVWDTVSSVGWFSHLLKLPFSADNPDIAIGRHAIAIDERRAFFQPNLWWPHLDRPAHGPLDLKQVWFPGGHSDVGGGYPNAESAQSQLALEWMLVEACAAGLLVDPERVAKILGYSEGSPYIRPGVGQPLHETLTPAWWPGEFLLKPYFDVATGQSSWRMHLGRRRTVPSGARVHASAFQRGQDYLKRLPGDVVEEPHTDALSVAHWP